MKHLYATCLYNPHEGGSGVYTRGLGAVHTWSWRRYSTAWSVLTALSPTVLRTHETRHAGSTARPRLCIERVHNAACK
jgi:hypothetical protein